MRLDEATHARLTARFGAAVDPWWERLPGVLAELAERWELNLGDPVGRGATSLVLRCRRADGSAAILKLTPDAALGRAEAAAVRQWALSGRVPALWEHDPETGALLLEALPAEAPLSVCGREVTVDEIAGLIGALHRSGSPVARDGIVPLCERVEFVFEHWAARRPEHAEALRRGHRLARVLATAVNESVLLHGDLHPGNVLDGGPARGLVAIDPRPCVGDGAFDAVDWVVWAVEPSGWRTRCDALATALGVDAKRLWAWCEAFAALLAGSAAQGADPARAAALLALSRGSAG